MKKNSYSYNELINCGEGKLFGPGNAKLPLPPMLMFDRITEITDDKGAFNKGSLKAELDIKKNLWFFDCHFKEDPVMPGCLGLDAMWQLVGFYLGWIGNPGKGRALGVGTVKFTGEILQNVKLVKYIINMNVYNIELRNHVEIFVTTKKTKRLNFGGSILFSLLCVHARTTPTGILVTAS